MSAFRSGGALVGRSRSRAERRPHAATPVPVRRRLLCQLPVRLRNAQQAGGRRSARRSGRRLPRHGGRFGGADRRRGTEEPWLVFSGDSLLIGDVGRPDLHVAGDADGQARLLHASLRRLLELPDHVVLYPSHYAGSVCGRGLSGNPVSSIGFERAHNPMLAISDADAFVTALLAEPPPRPTDQEAILAANRSGRIPTRV